MKSIEDLVNFIEETQLFVEKQHVRDMMRVCNLSEMTLRSYPRKDPKTVSIKTLEQICDARTQMNKELKNVYKGYGSTTR